MPKSQKSPSGRTDTQRARDWERERDRERHTKHRALLWTISGQ